MATTKPSPRPVTTEQMPWTRCGQCGRQVFYRQQKKGAAAAALTEHYTEQHLGELIAAPA